MLAQQKMTDMTEGNPVKHILLFAIPLFIGNIFQQLYNLADTMIAGYNLGQQAIGAIGATSTIYSLLFCLAVGFNNGFAIIVSREFGAKNIEKLKKSIAIMISLNIFITIILTAISLIFLKPFMILLNTPDDIFSQAYSYIVIIIGGLIMTIFYNLCAGILRALGNSRTPLLFLIISCIINIILDILFIMVFHTNVWGAALATVIAETISGVLCAIYIIKNYKEILPKMSEFRWDGNLAGEMFTTGLSMGLMLSVFSIGSVVLQSGINKLGTTIITAHTSARRIVEMFMQPLSTIAMANSTFISQNWGGKQADRIKSTMKKVFGMEIIWSLFSLLIISIFGEAILHLVTGTNDKIVISNALMNMKINAFLFCPLGILLALRSAMQSMGYKIIPVVTSGFELLIKIVSTYLVIPIWGYVGASCTEPFTWIICMIFILSIYLIKQKELYNRIQQ